MVALDKIHITDALKGLKKLKAESVDCIVTSPPYWAKRDYKIPPTRWPDGTRRALGLEPELGRFIQHLCDFFDEAKRVLRKTGTLWVVLGDTYGGNWGNWSTVKGVHNNQAGDTTTPLSELLQQRISRKSVCMIPERFAIEMVRRGWILRNKIVWHKPNHMPESVRDRFACSWEHVFLFSRSSKYYFDLDAIRVPHVSPMRKTPGKVASPVIRKSPDLRGRRMPPAGARHPNGKNPGDCWSLTTTPFPEAHFAVYPEKLCVRPILAGCPRFVCAKCGTPKLKTGSELYGKEKERRCQCNAGFVPGVVLDPFMGAGTTAVVAKQLKRNFIGFELNPKYVRMANRRLKKAKPDLGESTKKQKRKGGAKVV